MGEHEIIKPHSFEEAKKHIKEFSDRTSPDLGLDKVSTSGGLFGWFDHNVTGEELNRVSGQIQDYLIKFNGLHSDFINEFGQVYKALESLDKEYIPAILSAVKGAELASDQAKSAQKDIRKIIDGQKKTIKILEDHKAKLDKLKHLTNIDEIWSTSRALLKDMDSFKGRADKLKKQLGKLEGNIKALQKFADEILDYEHLENIDEMWEKIVLFEDELSKNTNKIENLTSTTESYAHMLEDICNSISFIDEIEHLRDVDTIWSDVEKHNEDLSMLQQNSKDASEGIKDLKKKYTELVLFKEDLEQQSHLKEIDQIWDKVGSNKENVDKLNQESKEIEFTIRAHTQELEKLYQLEHTLDVDDLWSLSNENSKRITELKESVDGNSNSIDELENQLYGITTDIELIKRKLKISLFLGGSAVVVCVVELVLHLAMVL